jgi:Cdc6-like AAA superfamily ATPase
MLPTDEQQAEIWDGDLLDRRNEAEFLQEYLDKVSENPSRALDRESFVLNLKGSWGSGKTFFLRRFAQQLRESQKLVVEIDAWKANPDVDPLVTIVAEIKLNIDKHFPSGGTVANAFQKLRNSGGAAAKAFAKASITHILKKAVGSGFEDALKELNNSGSNNTGQPSPEEPTNRQNMVSSATNASVDAAFDSLATSTYFEKLLDETNTQKVAIERFCRSVEELTESIRNSSENFAAPMYIIIDELDRCRPLFAIETLERVNHLFDSKGVVFIIGTDSDELAHSIKAVYGSEFSAERYLNRFFGLTYHLTTPNDLEYSSFVIDSLEINFGKFSCPGGLDPKITTSRILSRNLENLREIRQVAFLIGTFADSWSRKSKIDTIYLAYCAIVAFKNNQQLTSDLKGASIQQSQWAQKGIRTMIEYHDGNGRRTSMSDVSYIDKLTHMGRSAVKHILRSDLKSGSTLETHIRSCLEEAGRLDKSATYMVETPYWMDYYSMLQTVSKLSLNAEQAT